MQKNARLQMESKTGWGYSSAEATQERHACISICPQRNMKTIFDEQVLIRHGRQPHYVRLGELKAEFVNDTTIEKYVSEKM